jgi:hypothetical protein
MWSNKQSVVFASFKSFLPSLIFAEKANNEERLKLLHLGMLGLTSKYHTLGKVLEWKKHSSLFIWGRILNNSFFRILQMLLIS